MKNLQTEEWIAIVLAVAAAIGMYVLLSTNQVMSLDENDTQELTNNENNETMDNLEITTTVAGDGPIAESGDLVVVNYRGRLASNGEEFDNSYDRGQPFPVLLGQNQVIQGWEQGLLGAQAGESRTLEIPAELGYGELGTPGGPIPGNADLIFEIEVLQVIKQGDLPAELTQ